MESKLFLAALLLGVFTCGLCKTCTSPEVTSITFTTQDATIVSNIAFISEFSIKCETGSLSNLYADVEGNVVPVSAVGEDKFQVSWTEDTKTARSGDKVVRIFDEDGYTAFRKASRAGDDTSAIAPLIDVIVNHPGAFNGPWLKSEFLATIVSVVIAYVAISSKSKLSS